MFYVEYAVNPHIIFENKKNIVICLGGDRIYFSVYRKLIPFNDRIVKQISIQSIDQFSYVKYGKRYDRY